MFLFSWQLFVFAEPSRSNKHKKALLFLFKLEFNHFCHFCNMLRFYQVLFSGFTFLLYNLLHNIFDYN